MSAAATRKGSRIARIASAGVIALGLLALVESLRWRGAPFPDFFLMPNRVVPSAALPGWSGIAEGRPLYRELLLAVDDAPVGTGDEAYRRAAGHPVGEPMHYLFSGKQQIEARTFALRSFDDREYVSILGAYFLSGIACAVLALVAGERWRESAGLGSSGVRLLAGAVAGVVTLAIVLAISGLSGGIVPVNVTAWVGYLFPLAALGAFRLPPVPVVGRVGRKHLTCGRSRR